MEGIKKMNAEEMKKLKEKNKEAQLNSQFEGAYTTLMSVIQEMASDGLDYLITDSDFEVPEAQYICQKLIDQGYIVHAIQTGNSVAIEVDWS